MTDGINNEGSIWTKFGAQTSFEAGKGQPEGSA